MNYLLDTQLLLWALIAPERLPSAMSAILEEGSNAIWFSVASLWEIGIKHSLSKQDFPVSPDLIWKAARDTHFAELAIEPRHIFAVTGLPWIHRDPFDRLLVAQAQVTGMQLLSVDANVERYFES